MSNAICKWCKREWLHLGMDDKCPYCRVRELEDTIGAMTEAHAHDDQALTAAYLSGAHEGKKQAEAERDALRERCDELEWLREVEAWRPPATHHNNGNGSGKRWFNSCQEYSATLQAALAATEVK